MVLTSQVYKWGSILAEEIMFTTMGKVRKLGVPKAELSVIHNLLLEEKSLEMGGGMLGGGFHDFLTSGKLGFPY